jgi:hypothetical protein
LPHSSFGVTNRKSLLFAWLQMQSCFVRLDTEQFPNSLSTDFCKESPIAILCTVALSSATGSKIAKSDHMIKPVLFWRSIEFSEFTFLYYANNGWRTIQHYPFLLHIK